MDHSHDQAKSALAAKLEAEGVKFMLASYVDLHGVPKGKVVPIAHLDRMMSGSDARERPSKACRKT
jgi:glutamine synthetase